MENRPLVSIIIITYNSSGFVSDTLNSAVAQTYPNFEIIISDDCSTDNTIEICHSWIEAHKNCEKRIEIVEAEKNTGVSGNCNRGLAKAKGQWLKFIAGDDILAPTALENYIDFVNAHPNVRHFIAKNIHFSGQLQNQPHPSSSLISPFLYRDEVTVKFQYKVIRRCFFGDGPTYFINADVLRDVGGFDERFPMQEDYPLFIKMIGRGYKMMLMDKVTVYYRVVENSVQHDREKDAIFRKNHVRLVVEYKYLYKKEVLDPLWKIFYYYSLWIQSAIIKSGNTYKSIMCKILLFIYKCTDPFVWYSRFIHRKNLNYLKKYSN